MYNYFMNNDKKNILIVGNGAVASALAKKFLQYSSVGHIFVTASESINCEGFEYVDIRDDDLTGLLKFVLENDITLTVPISELALKSDITSFFQSNGQNIFAPAVNASSNIINKVKCKKLLYKNKAQSTKFAIHSKYSQAVDYIKCANFPIIISTAEPVTSQTSSMLCVTLSQALSFVEKIFLNGEQDVLIQEYAFGADFTAYFITDGYSAIPLTTVRNFKFENDDKSGKYTNGIGCFAPDYKVSNIVLDRIQNVIQNVLNDFENRDSVYVGIIGAECVLAENDKFYIQDLKPFLQVHDARAVLNLCDDNLIDIITACINGSFSDDYEQIKMNNCSCAGAIVSVPVSNLIETNDENSDIDYNNVQFADGKLYSKGESSFVITKTAGTLSRAKEKLKQELEEMQNMNIKYRKGICDKI